MKKLQLNINNQGKKISLYFVSAAMLAMAVISCSKQLDVKNPNNPTFGVNVTDEAGLAAYSKASIYFSGFNYGDGWLGDSYFSLPWGYHELMGDITGGGQGSNNQTTTMGVPDKFIADPADASNTTVVNSSPQALGIIRAFNNSAATANANNALYYEWLNMYAMISGCNQILESVETVPLSADKANAVKAWAYWWKGYAYAQIGTLYYAGLIVEHPNEVVSNFVKQSDIIVESNKYLNLASTTLAAVTNQADYSAMITRLIPAQCQVGLGLPLSSAEWIKTINTMLARNILLNHLAPYVNGNENATISKSTITAMTPTDWAAVIDLCNKGVQQGDHVFTGRTSESNSFFSTSLGSVAGILTASNQSTTYKLSERLVQQYKTGDKRLANFSTGNGTFYGDANTNSTRYSLVDGDAAGLTVPVLGSRNVGALEIYIGPTYEENELMLAEAKMRTGDIAAGLTGIDKVRAYQKAGVPAVAGSSLSLSAALKELTMERLAALALRGLSFYDLRRWGWTYSIANGGGRYGSTLIYNAKVYNNATIDYNFMDYWDVPGDEVEKNPPAADSAPVVNANY